MTVVSIHQPNFAPWTGYFDKLRQADVFVLLDTVPYSKGSFANRVHILGADGPQWLTVPVLTKGRLGQLTADVEINDARPWRDEHVRTIQTRYGRAPHVGDVVELLGGAYGEFPPGEGVRLADLCSSLLARFVDYLGWQVPLVRASSLVSTGPSSDLLASIVKQIGGGVYLSGPSGKSYLDESVFARRGIEVRYHSYQPRTYDQGGRTFVPRLSILDAIAWCGSDAGDRI